MFIYEACRFHSEDNLLSSWLDDLTYILTQFCVRDNRFASVPRVFGFMVANWGWPNETEIFTKTQPSVACVKS